MVAQGPRQPDGLASPGRISMWSLSDESLLAGLASGEAEPAAAFVRRFQARVYGLALTIVGGPPSRRGRALLHLLIWGPSSQTGVIRTRRVRPSLARSAFAGFCFPPEVIVLSVRWYLRWHCCIWRSPRRRPPPEPLNVAFDRGIDRFEHFLHLFGRGSTSTLPLAGDALRSDATEPPRPTVSPPERRPPCATAWVMISDVTAVGHWSWGAGSDGRSAQAARQPRHPRSPAARRTSWPHGVRRTHRILPTAPQGSIPGHAVTGAPAETPCWDG